MARRSATVARLEEHPNLEEILGVLAQLAHISDRDLPVLAEGWTNTVAVAEARSKALSPDSPLICEVLASFEAVSALFADDLAGEAPYLVNEASVASTALKAVRDAIAAVYARPILARGEHTALLAPWRRVFPQATVDEPDLGPQSDLVKSLLAMMPTLADRCHDDAGQALFEALVDRSFAAESDRAEAVEAAFQAAVLTSRRRIWALIRRSGAEGMSRPCATCRRGPGGPDRSDREHQRVMTLCLDAACALLVADALPDESFHMLTTPVTSLIPGQRRPEPSS